MFSNLIKQRKKEMAITNFEVFGFPNVFFSIKIQWVYRILIRYRRKEVRKCDINIAKSCEFCINPSDIKYSTEEGKTSLKFIHVLVKKKKKT